VSAAADKHVGWWAGVVACSAGGLRTARKTAMPDQVAFS